PISGFGPSTAAPGCASAAPTAAVTASRTSRSPCDKTKETSVSARRGLDQYEPVEDRLRRFWDDHPEGRVITALVHRDERQYLVRAEVYTNRDDERPAATGYAEEQIGSSKVNTTNALENAETSAVGRALANLNYAPKGARASREEMEKATRGRLPAPQEPTPAQARAQLGKVCKEKGWDSIWVGELYESDYGVSLGDDTNVERILGFADILAERIAQAEAQQ